jgi:hypothetical protein
LVWRETDPVDLDKDLGHLHEDVGHPEKSVDRLEKDGF